jgi:hypothetical protein
MESCESQFDTLTEAPVGVEDQPHTKLRKILCTSDSGFINHRIY